MGDRLISEISRAKSHLLGVGAGRAFTLRSLLAVVKTAAKILDAVGDHHSACDLPYTVVDDKRRAS